MGDINRTLISVRTVIFGITIFFAFITLALGAAISHWTSVEFEGAHYAFAALAIATAILTLLTLPAMLFFSLTRKGSFMSLIALEFGWTAFLWIMWLAVGGSAADTGFVALSNCGDLHFFRSAEATCRETQAITAFGFLTWIMLFGYNIFLLVLIVRQHLRGNSGIWSGYIADADFAAAGNAGPGPSIPEPKVGGPAPAAYGQPQYPPQQQHQYVQQPQQQYAQPPQTTGQSVQQPGSPYPQV